LAKRQAHALVAASTLKIRMKALFRKLADGFAEGVVICCLRFDAHCSLLHCTAIPNATAPKNRLVVVLAFHKRQPMLVCGGFWCEGKTCDRSWPQLF
jgi:hypothetical protein